MKFDIRDAALIVTFYCPRDDNDDTRAKKLVEHLTSGFNLEAVKGEKDFWRDQATPIPGTLLRRIELPPAPSTIKLDTTVVQLTLNARPHEKVPQAWHAQRRRLKCVKLDELLNHNSIKDDQPLIWGYTLVYQAVSYRNNLFRSSIDNLDDTTLQNLMAATLDLSSTCQPPRRPLAESKIPGGKLWLMSIPLDGDGIKAATVYMAIGPESKQEQLLRAVYGPGAYLLMPDLIAHKGYFERRQYSLGNSVKIYKKWLIELRDKDMQLILKTINPADSKNSLTKTITTSEMLDNITNIYNPIIGLIPYLQKIQISIDRQVYNYNQWNIAIARDVLDYHRKYLEVSDRELQLLLTEGRSVLETVHIAMEIVQTKINKSAEERQRFINYLLAVIAAALSVPQMLDREAVSLLPYTKNCLVDSASTPNQCYQLMLLLCQIIITIIIAILSFCLVRKILGNTK